MGGGHFDDSACGRRHHTRCCLRLSWPWNDLRAETVSSRRTRTIRGAARYIREQRASYMQIAATIIAVLFGFLAVILATVFVSAFRSGKQDIARLRRKRYGLRTWAAGGLPRTTSGATMHELEGIELKAQGGKLVHVRQTRAPSAELI